MIKNIKKTVALAVLAVSASGCATILDGGNKVVSLKSSNNKKVEVEVHSATGPQKLTLPAQITPQRSGDDLRVKVTDKCYDNREYVYESSVTPAFFVNFLLLGGSTGTTIDVSTGNIWTYDNEISVPVTKNKKCK